MQTDTDNSVVESLTLTSPTTASPSTSSTVPQYEMKIDLRVLEHLGIRLYSNSAAVLSEVVANSWDADAHNVSIDIDNDKVVIVDDGIGMDLEAVNKRFLSVGYDKRTKEGGVSALTRPFMGRKGIGKLSLFSLAEVIEVHTTKNGEKHAFLMNVNDIQRAIKDTQTYYPEVIDYKGEGKGTKIILTSLKRQRASSTKNPLIKRIARRFSVIGHLASPKGPFNVKINGHTVTTSDRDDLAKIEFLWEFGGSDSAIVGAAKKVKHTGILLNTVNTDEKWLVKGWLGTVSKPAELKSDDSGSMNGIVVMARGRLIQENILDKLGFNKILANYLVGQVEADFLDEEHLDDIATSDRQRLIEDDPRYIALVVFLKNSLESIAPIWTEKRNAERYKDAEIETPVLADWVSSLDVGQKEHAQSMLGLIKGLELEKEEERVELYKAGILAFERLRLKSTGNAIAQLSDLSAVNLLPLLADLNVLEASMYRDIVKQRIEVISKFEKLVKNDDKEKVLQQALFDNMWLLDPGWERATGSAVIEEALKTEYSIFASTLTDEQSKGRIDIRYRTNAGEHIIVELKRAGRVLSVVELLEQGDKYRDGLEKCLRQKNGIDYIPNISVVFVVGEDLKEHPRNEYIGSVLSSINARVVYYQQLINSAKSTYQEYMLKSEKVDKIENILKGM